MGYKIEFDNGHQVEFETKPSDADIEAVYAQSKTWKPPTKKQESSATSAFAKSAVENALPSAGGLAGAMGALSVGAPLIAGATAATGPVGGFLTGLGVGIAGGFGGSALVGAAQDQAMSYVPESFKESLGFGKEQRKQEQQENPNASFAGGLAPNLLAFRPGALAPVLDKAGNVILSSGAQRAGMAGIGGGIEAGTQAIHGDLDAKKIAMAAAFQGVAATPTSLAKRVFPSLRHGETTSEKGKESPTTAQEKINKIIEDSKPKKEAVPEPVVTKEEQARSVMEEEARLAKLAEEQPTLDLDGQGPAPFEMGKSGGFAKDAHVVIDENGMPIDAGRTLEAQNLENPLQRNLWGDELTKQHPQESGLNLTDALTAKVEEARQTPWETENSRNLQAMQEPSQASPALQAAVNKANDTHPFIAKAEREVAKAEQDVAKARDNVESGVGLPVAVKQAEARLAKAETKLSLVKYNLEKPSILEKTRPSESVGVVETKKPLEPEKAPEVEVNFEKKAEGEFVNSVLGNKFPELSRDAKNAEELIAQASTSKDVPDKGLYGKTIEQFTKGFLFEKLKTNNPIIKAVHSWVNDALNTSQARFQTLIKQKLAPRLRGLSDKEFVEVKDLLLHAMKEQTVPTKAAMMKSGLTKKQIRTVLIEREIQRKNFTSFNEGRKALGLPPVDEFTAYQIGLASGNFRITMFKDRFLKDGTKVPEVVGVVGADFKPALKSRLESMQKQHPDWYASDIVYNGTHKARSEMQPLQEALQLLSDHNPNFKEFSEALKNTLVDESIHSLGMHNRAKNKKGIEGMQGDQPWQNSKKNAEEFFNAQIRATEMMGKWSELAKVSSELHKVFSDPTLQKTQKNAIEMSKNYLDRAMGKNPSDFGATIDNQVGILGEKLGIGPNIVKESLSMTRNMTNFALFFSDIFYLALNGIQPILAAPVTAAFLRQRGISTGLDPTGISNMITNGLSSTYKKFNGIESTPFDKQIWEQAKTAGIDASQLLLTAPHTRPGLGHKMEMVSTATSTVFETIPRSITYASIAHMLRKAGFEKDPQMWTMVDDLTKMAMVDYRHHEQAKMHDNLGMFGEVTRNLTSFPLHQVGMYNMMIRDAVNKQQGQALLAAVLTSVAMSGIKGIMGYQEANFIVTHVSEANDKPTTLDKILLDWTEDVNNKTSSRVGDAIAMGSAGFAGLDISAKTSTSSIVPGMSGGSGKVVDVAKAAWNLGTEQTPWKAKLLAKSASIGITDPLIKPWFTRTDADGGETAINSKGNATIKRNKDDIFWSNVGLRGSHESRKAAQEYAAQRQDKFYLDKQTKVMTRIKEELANSKGNLSEEFIRNNFKEYMKYQGTDVAFSKALETLPVSFATNVRVRRVLQNSGGSLSNTYKLQRGYAE